MIRGMFGPGTIVLGGVAVLMAVFLVVGFVLPTEWTASADALVDAPPEALMELVDSPEGWRVWTAWPDSGLTRSGPARGAGSGISWSDRELGRGAFTIGDVRPGAEVRYSVEVEGAANTVMTTTGVIRMTPEGPGTRVHWDESGDLGRNPLMGWWALAMERAQSTEMAKSLDRLSQAADSIRSGSAPSR